MTLHSGLQRIAIRKLSNILQNKDNQTMKSGQLIKLSNRNILKLMWKMR